MHRRIGQAESSALDHFEGVATGPVKGPPLGDSKGGETGPQAGSPVDIFTENSENTVTGGPPPPYSHSRAPSDPSQHEQPVQPNRPELLEQQRETKQPERVEQPVQPQQPALAAEPLQTEQPVQTIQPAELEHPTPAEQQEQPQGTKEIPGSVGSLLQGLFAEAIKASRVSVHEDGKFGAESCLDIADTQEIIVSLCKTFEGVLTLEPAFEHIAGATSIRRGKRVDAAMATFIDTTMRLLGAIALANARDRMKSTASAEPSPTAEQDTLSRIQDTPMSGYSWSDGNTVVSTPPMPLNEVQNGKFSDTEGKMPYSSPNKAVSTSMEEITKWTEFGKMHERIEVKDLGLQGVPSPLANNDGER